MEATEANSVSSAIKGILENDQPSRSKTKKKEQRVYTNPKFGNLEIIETIKRKRKPKIAQISLTKVPDEASVIVSDSDASTSQSTLSDHIYTSEISEDSSLPLQTLNSEQIAFYMKIVEDIIKFINIGNFSALESHFAKYCNEETSFLAFSNTPSPASSSEPSSLRDEQRKSSLSSSLSSHNKPDQTKSTEKAKERQGQGEGERELLYFSKGVGGMMDFYRSLANSAPDCVLLPTGPMTLSKPKPLPSTPPPSTPFSIPSSIPCYSPVPLPPPPPSSLNPYPPPPLHLSSYPYPYPTQLLPLSPPLDPHSVHPFLSLIPHPSPSLPHLPSSPPSPLLSSLPSWVESDLTFPGEGVKEREGGEGVEGVEGGEKGWAEVLVDDFELNWIGEGQGGGGGGGGEGVMGEWDWRVGVEGEGEGIGVGVGVGEEWELLMTDMESESDLSSLHSQPISLTPSPTPIPTPTPTPHLIPLIPSPPSLSPPSPSLSTLSLSLPLSLQGTLLTAPHFRCPKLEAEQERQEQQAARPQNKKKTSPSSSPSPSFPSSLAHEDPSYSSPPSHSLPISHGEEPLVIPLSLQSEFSFLPEPVFLNLRGRIHITVLSSSLQPSPSPSPSPSLSVSILQIKQTFTHIDD